MIRTSFLLFLLACSQSPAAPSIAGLEADRARYAPGDSVHVRVYLRSPHPEGALLVRWYHLDSLLSSASITVRPSRSDSSPSAVLHWKAPETDFEGYLLRVALRRHGKEVETATIAVDVSSRWSRYPRYGFVSSYPSMSPDAIRRVVDRLARLHINGVQFYDWQYQHHRPLKGTAERPATRWKDIANRDVAFATVKGYIDAMHARGMTAMAYNLLYGAYPGGARDGVDTASWALYKDPDRASRFMYTLPAGWAGNLYFMNPADTAWQNYVCRAEGEVFRALPFDGWHVDQVGDNGPMYDARGRPCSVKAGFAPFLARARAALNVPLVMNAVNQYGQQEIASSPVEFLYSEVWDCAATYRDLMDVVRQNRSLSGGRGSSVLAAYVNYDLSGRPGMFNTPGVLLADAVIMASGAAHLELGEHMLAHEYFPNNNLRMSAELAAKLTSYYDFLVAYESLLRGEGAADRPALLADTALFSPSGRSGAAWVFARECRGRTVYQLINLNGITSLEWRDRAGLQAAPAVRQGDRLELLSERAVTKIWLASPDFDGGMPRSLPFARSGGRISVAIPRLEYWDMLVVE